MTHPRPQGRREVRALLERHGRYPNKQLGQHFLADPNIVERIVRLAGVTEGDLVVEIGTGTGSLTRALCAAGARVVTYEVDRGLAPLLVDSLAGLDNIDLRYADATGLDLTAELVGGPWAMVANLPYQIATPLVLDTLRDAPAVTKLVVMVQREVAERLVAGPGSKAYGIPSVVVALRARAAVAFTVPPHVFVPAPNVESAVVTLTRIEPPPLARRAEELSAAAFRQRRKMVRGSLRNVLPRGGADLEAAGIDPTSRAEDLEPGDFLRLAEVAP